jgi:hypothetical protein
MVFNTIAFSNTHLNGSVGIVFASCTSTAGECDLVSIATLQQQASAHGNGHPVSTDGRGQRGRKHHCA